MIHWRSSKWALSEDKPHTHLFMCSNPLLEREMKTDIPCIASSFLQMTRCRYTLHPIAFEHLTFHTFQANPQVAHTDEHNITQLQICTAFSVTQLTHSLASQVNTTKLCQVGHCFVVRDDDNVWKKMKKNNKKKSVQQREGKSSGCKKRKKFT
jgi:hypothetical protein